MIDKEAEQIFLSWRSYHLQVLAPQAVADFYRFLASWMMFNTLYNQPDQISGGPLPNNWERTRVESFEHPDAFGNVHIELLGSDLDYANAVNFIVNRNPSAPAWMAPRVGVRVWNMNRAYRTDLSKQGCCAAPNDLKGLLGCLYVARCNLVHGDKGPGNAFDIELCQNAHKILSSLLLNYTIK